MTRTRQDEGSQRARRQPKTRPRRFVVTSPFYADVSNQPRLRTSGECVLTNRRKHAPRPGFYLPVRSCAPADFTLKKTRIYFTRCRSALRSLLAGYLAVPTTEIRFEYLTSGKPQLAAEQNPRALQFNVSHSANMALIAVGSECRLGVDIEKIRSEVDTASLAERFFSLRDAPDSGVPGSSPRAGFLCLLDA